MPGDPARETYTHGYSNEALQLFGSRTAAVDAFFLVPHLSPGMAVLDCGCGPGSIAVDLAEIVAPTITAPICAVAARTAASFGKPALFGRKALLACSVPGR